MILLKRCIYDGLIESGRAENNYLIEILTELFDGTQLATEFTGADSTDRISVSFSQGRDQGLVQGASPKVARRWTAENGKFG